MDSNVGGLKNQNLLTSNQCKTIWCWFYMEIERKKRPGVRHKTRHSRSKGSKNYVKPYRARAKIKFKFGQKV